MKNAAFRFLPTAALATAAFAFLPHVQAVPTLRVSIDGGADIVIQDGLAPDSSLGLAGSVNWQTPAPVGGWQIVITGGTTKPLNGSATAAETHLNISATSSSQAVASTLNIRFSEDFFGPIASGSFRVDTSGVLDASPGSATNSATLRAHVDGGNTLFVQTSLLATSTFGPGGTGSNQFSPTFNLGTYSITNQIQLTHAAGAGRSSSMQIDVIQNVPEGGLTLTLLGGAILALAAIRRKVSA